MIDRLLGRARLKERVAELEDERDSYRERYEAEAERRQEAARKRQDAEERVNRLEDRVAELEDRVERAAADGDADPEYRGRERLRGARLEAVLDRLASVDAGPEGALTAMVADGHPGEVEEAFGGRAALVDRAAPCLAYADDAGLVGAVLVPPVAPEPFATWSDGFRVDREWFLPAGEFAFALVRSDLFALGEYDGRERASLRGFTSDVKADHSKGGFSQGRFERVRDGQIEDHLDRVREALTDRRADRLYVVGERTLLGEFEDVADATAAVDATGDPGDAIEDAFRDFWSVDLRLV